IQAPSIGIREDGIPGDRDERLDLPLAGRLDLVGEGRHRELAVELREAADAAPPAIELTRLAEATGHPGEVHGGSGEHGAAGSVEVPRDEVDRVDQPGGQAA